jgi:hypothetical protein
MSKSNLLLMSCRSLTKIAGSGFGSISQRYLWIRGSAPKFHGSAALIMLALLSVMIYSGLGSESKLKDKFLSFPKEIIMYCSQRKAGPPRSQSGILKIDFSDSKK